MSVNDDSFGRQFSQPMLPGMNVKPMAEHRWPRGFTPERQAEVRDRLSRVGVRDRAGLTTPPGRLESYVRGPSARSQQFRRRVQDTISRSTMPVEHLKGLEHIEQHQTPGMGANTGAFAAPLGTYSSVGELERSGVGEPLAYTGPTVKINAWGHLRSGKRVPDKGDDIKVTPMEHTLIHELGHHAHFTGQIGPEGEWKDRHENGKRTGADPVLEGRAEAYGRQHWRQDPRDARVNPVQFKANYDQSGSWGDLEDSRKFNLAYHGTIDKPKMPWAPDPAKGEVGLYPSGHTKYVSDPDVEGQQRLFSRHKPFDPEPHKSLPDLGQWPLYQPAASGRGEDETTVSTIKVGRGVAAGLASKQFGQAQAKVKP